MRDEKAVVLLSGGMDSVVLLYHAIEKYGKSNVFPLAIHYKQRHAANELRAAGQTCLDIGIHLRVVKLETLGEVFTNNALTGGGELPKGDSTSSIMKKNVVPNRNMILLSVAAGLAINEGYNTVAYGAQASGQAIYADARPAFVEAMQQALAVCDDNPIKLWAPFVNASKASIVSLGEHYNVNWQNTWTCYDHSVTPCQQCGTCDARRKAFSEAGVVDTLLQQQQ